MKNLRNNDLEDVELLDNFKLADSVKLALRAHVKENELLLSKHEIDNAWKTFSNLVAFDVKQSEQTSRRALNGLSVGSEKKDLFGKAVKAIGWSIPAFGVLAGLSLYSTESFNVNSTNKMEITSAVRDETLNTFVSTSREYELPKPQHFSEMVNFVKEEPKERTYFNKTNLDQRFYAELESSLKQPLPFDNDNQFLTFVSND